MIYVKVAERTFAIHTRKQEAFLHLISGAYSPFLSDLPDRGEQLLFSVDLDKPTTLPEAKPLKVFEYMLTDDTATLRIYQGRYILSILNKASGRTFTIDCQLDSASDVAEYNFTSDIAIQDIAPPRHIIDHLLIFAFSVAGLADNILLIHASTITYRDKAVMFLAESGTGKSTHTRMWMENITGTTLLNDDAPALHIGEDGVVYAYGTPWSGKTPCCKNEKYPLAALVRIRRAPYNKMIPLNSIAAFGALLPSCMPTLQYDDALLDAVCSVISEVMQSVPIWTLECLPNPNAAYTSNAALFPVDK